MLATPYEQRCFVARVKPAVSRQANEPLGWEAIITGEMGSLKVEPSSAGAPAKYRVGRPVLSPADLLG